MTLKEEIESTEFYIFLVKMHYDKNLVIQTQIEDKFKWLNLPPLTIQTLIENAVKHNEISNRKPLAVSIRTTDDGCLEVKNPS